MGRNDQLKLAKLLFLIFLLAPACQPPERGIFGLCSDGVDGGTDGPGVSQALTYAADIKPIIDVRCTRCHQDGGMGPFSLVTYEEVFANRFASQQAIETGHMPPWQPAACCAPLEGDWSMPLAEREKFVLWVQQRAPSGDLSSVAPTPERPSAIARVDVTIKMPAPYKPRPPRGSTDDTRCFVADWPVGRDAYVTAMDTVPGNRKILHHLLVAVVSGRDGIELRKRENRDGQPGYSCQGGAFGSKVTRFLGGGVGGTEFPRNLGTKVEGDAKLVLQVHYSTINDPAGTATDQTAVQFRVDDSAREGKAIVITNPFWVVGDGMKVKAGDPDAVYFYRYRPVVFTGGKTVLIEGATPHMHAFGSKFLIGIIHKDGRRECLLEIPDWHFGWEQGYWLSTPRLLAPDDQVYVECHFDNSLQRQPVVDGVHLAPRDFAWGGDNQDMCAGFLTFTEMR